MGYYVNSSGGYMGFFDEESAPIGGGFVNLKDNAPEYGDQVWLFPGWSESPSQNINSENQWREEQMARIANQLLMIEDEDPDAEPGTKRQWMDYRIALRKWVTDSNTDFPDSSKRPVAPS